MSSPERYALGIEKRRLITLQHSQEKGRGGGGGGGGGERERGEFGRLQLLFCLEGITFLLHREFVEEFCII